MTFRGRDLFSIRVPRSGARYNSLYERMEAARWRGYSDAAFDQLSQFEQARIVAHYRCHYQLEACIAQAAQRDAEIRAKQRGRKAS